jgi:hypothetical protein
MGKYAYEGRTEQRKAALKRQWDANLLREAHHWRGAMYMLGYAIECKLKAKLMEKYGVHTLTQLEDELSRRDGNKIKLGIHSLPKLFELTKADHRLDSEQRRRFSVCGSWDHNWRYDPSDGNETECDDFFGATGWFLEFVKGSV